MMLCKLLCLDCTKMLNFIYFIIMYLFKPREKSKLNKITYPNFHYMYKISASRIQVIILTKFAKSLASEKGIKMSKTINFSGQRPESTYFPAVARPAKTRFLAFDAEKFYTLLVHK